MCERIKVLFKQHRGLIFSFILIVISLILIVWGFNKILSEKKGVEKNDYVVIYIEEDYINKRYHKELYDRATGIKEVYKNGKLVRKEKLNTISKLKGILRLPLVSNGVDIINDLKVGKKYGIVYEVDIDDSAKYIKYLLDNGGEILYYKATPMYIDYRIKFKNQKYRIMILPDRLLISKV